MHQDISHVSSQQRLDSMKLRHWLLSLICIIFFQVSRAEAPTASFHLYLPLDSLYKQDERQNYLHHHPEDVDIAIIVAKLALKSHAYPSARDLLLPYLWIYPAYTDLYLIIISADIAAKKYQEAKAIAQLGVIFAWPAPTLEKKYQDILALTHPKPKTNGLSHRVKQKPVYREPLAAVEPKTYLNEVGVFQQNYYISDVHQIWDYTSAFYARETSLGKLYGRINYANRLNREAPQFEAEFFPKLNQYVYLDIGGSLANQPFLFPHYMYQGEAFFVLPQIANLSAGGQFNRIDSIHQYTRFTGSVTKELGDHSLMFRPYFYIPGRGPASALYTLNYRFIFKDTHNYFGLVLGIGSTPDLADLLTVNFLKLQNKILSPYLNFMALNDRLTVNINLLYQNQVFPNRRVRDWMGASLGLAWKY